MQPVSGGGSGTTGTDFGQQNLFSCEIVSSGEAKHSFSASHFSRHPPADDSII